MMREEMASNPEHKVELPELTRTFGKIGLLSFGGPAGQIALMHRILVDEKRWIGENRFLHALNFCMLLPGPEAMQLATYCGWMLQGVKGGLIAGTLFVLPGVLVLLALSTLYVTFGDVPLVEGLLFGLKAAVLVIVIQALAKVSARALKAWPGYLLAIAGFLALALFKIPFPAVILVAALTGFFLPHLFGADDEPVRFEKVQRPWRHVVKVLSWGAVYWGMPLLALLYLLGRESVFFQEALFFSKAALVTFGGAYAVLAYVAQQAVEIYGWLKPDEMLTGLGLAETTPGPLVLVLVFVGFMGAFREAGLLDPVLAGLLGGLVTVWVTFIPCFIWIFLGAPFVETLRGNAKLSGALSAITAAVVGVIANLAFWFAIHVLFRDVGEITLGAISMDWPRFSSIDWRALVIAAGAGMLLFRGVGLLWVLLASTLAGAALVLFV
jgi:chromate transporter